MQARSNGIRRNNVSPSPCQTHEGKWSGCNGYDTAVIVAPPFVVFLARSCKGRELTSRPSFPTSLLHFLRGIMADPTADSTAQRPHLDDMPGMWPSTSANSFRQQFLAPGHLHASPNQDGISTSDVGLVSSTDQVSSAAAATPGPAQGMDDANRI